MIVQASVSNERNLLLIVSMERYLVIARENIHKAQESMPDSCIHQLIDLR